MRNEMTFFGAGLASGILLALAAQSVLGHSGRAALNEDVGGLDPVQQPVDHADAAADEPVRESRTSGGSRNSDTATDDLSEVDGTSDGMLVDVYERSRTELPAAYISMVEPRPLPENLTVQEMYLDFNTDERDESWAYPMELGITQHIARRGSELGMTIEFVECRSRFCTIAGIVHDGGQPTVNILLGEMTQSGWWQTFGGASTVGTSQDAEYRFVSIFPREESDATRGPGTPEP